jgi:hypothetical protein
MQRVFSAVDTEFLNIIQVTFMLQRANIKLLNSCLLYINKLDDGYQGQCHGIRQK